MAQCTQEMLDAGLADIAAFNTMSWVIIVANVLLYMLMSLDCLIKKAIRQEDCAKVRAWGIVLFSLGALTCVGGLVQLSFAIQLVAGGGVCFKASDQGLLFVCPLVTVLFSVSWAKTAIKIQRLGVAFGMRAIIAIPMGPQLATATTSADEHPGKKDLLPHAQLV